MRRLAVLVAVAFLGAGCGGGPQSSARIAPQQLGVPARPPASAPRFPELAIPAPPPSATRPGTGPVAMATHAAFFNGEVPLSNGVYYLKFPDGTPFGYYSYLTDSHYIYHFDLGYEYVFDTSDPNTAYMYDFASQHFWYTGQSLFPYVYDFWLVSFLYYYPASQADHYTTNPRYFYEFDPGEIITLPDPNPQYCSQAPPACSSGVTATDVGLGNYYAPPLPAGWYRRIVFANGTNSTVHVVFSFAGCQNVGPGNQFCIGTVIGGVVQRGWLGGWYLAPGQSINTDLQISSSAANASGTNLTYTKLCWMPLASGQSAPPLISCP